MDGMILTGDVGKFKRIICGDDTVVEKAILWEDRTGCRPIGGAMGLGDASPGESTCERERGRRSPQRVAHFMI